MRNLRRRSGTGAGRFLWGGLALLSAVLLGVSFLLASSAVGSAEASAQEHAERETASVLLNQLSPAEVSSDLVGTEFRDLLEVVQARILDDERVVRVRVWRADGNLVFSTAPRDDLGEIALPDDPNIQQAAEGTPNSVVSETRGANGQLFRTFVPMRVSDGGSPYAVAEFAQAYDVIKSDATIVWRVAQIVLVVALGSTLVMLAMTFRGGPVARPAGSARPTRDERKLRDAEERARGAERAARQAEERLAESEKRLKEAKTVRVPPDVLAKLDELEVKLKAEAAEREQQGGEMQRLKAALAAKEAEREQQGGEMQRLKAALAAKEAELALAREGEAATQAEVTRSAERFQEAKRLAADLEKRLTEAEKRGAELSARTGTADLRVGELETALRQAEERAARATADAEATRRDGESKAGAELAAARAEMETLRAQLAEMDALRRQVGEIESLRQQVAEVEPLRQQAAEVDALRQQLADTDALRNQVGETDALRAQLAEMDTLRRQVAEIEPLRQQAAEVDALRPRLADAESALAETRARLEDRERAVSESGAVRAEADGARAELDVTRADLSRAQMELETTRRELEEARTRANAATSELEDARSRGGATTAELDEARARAAASTSELDEARARIASLSAELEDVRTKAGAMVAAATSNGDEATAKIAQLEARLAEMDAQRHREIAELQRAHETLANTQAELVQSNRKLKEAQERARELEHGGAPRRSTRRVERAGLLSEPSDAPAVATRLASREEEYEPATPLVEPESQPEEPAAPDLPAEPMSLRERLARAAAARHRPSGTPG